MRFSLTSFCRWLVYLSILTTPITAWLALSETFRLPVVVLLMLFFISAPLFLKGKYKIKKSFFFKEDSLLILYLLAVILSIFSNISDLHVRNISNLIAFILVVFGFVFFVRVVWINTNMTILTLSKLSFYTSCILISIVLIEFILNNFLNTNLQQYFTIAEVYNAEGFPRAMWYASSSPAEEPGQVAFYLNIFYPFSYYYLFRICSNKLVGSVHTIFHFGCLVLTISTAGIIVFLSGFLLSLAFQFTFKGILRYSLATMAILLSIFLLNPYEIQQKLQVFIENAELIEKVTLSEKSVSSGTRTKTWAWAIEDFQRSPVFGNGPAYNKIYRDEASYHGFFTYSLANLGVFGFTIICLYFLSVWLRIFTFKEYRGLLPPLIFIFYVGFTKNLISDSYVDLPFWFAINSIYYLLWKKNEDFDYYTNL